eukprot:9518909-Alexandrium_andersonii.AAC.1
MGKPVRECAKRACGAALARGPSLIFVLLTCYVSSQSLEERQVSGPAGHPACKHERPLFHQVP